MKKWPQKETGESSSAKKLTKNQNGGQSEDEVAIARDTGWGPDDPYGLASTLEPKTAACFHVTQGLAG